MVVSSLLTKWSNAHNKISACSTFREVIDLDHDNQAVLKASLEEASKRRLAVFEDPPPPAGSQNCVHAEYNLLYLHCGVFWCTGCLILLATPAKKQSPRHGGSSWTLLFFFTQCLGLCFLGGDKKDETPCMCIGYYWDKNGQTLQELQKRGGHKEISLSPSSGQTQSNV